MKLNPRQLTVALIPFLLLGCGGGGDGPGDLPPGGDSSVGSDDPGSGGNAAGGGVSIGGSDAGGTSAGGVSTGGSSSEEFTPWGMCAFGEVAINPILTSDFVGRGACYETTLAQAIAQTHEAYPDLANVTTLYGESDDGFINDEHLYAFEKGNGAFQLAFFQGSGDCEAGCIDSAWTYIEMNEDCQPERAGSFSAAYSGEGNCREVSGTPMWGKPAARPSNNDCGLEDVYADFSGTFEVPFSGTRMPCSDKSGDALQEEVSGTLTMTLVQDPEDPSVGTATFSGDDLDPEWLGAKPYEIRFDYFQATINSQWDNLPAMCLESRDVDVTLDFEGCSESELSMFEARDVVCGGDYCKGDLALKLDLSGIQLELRD